MTRELKNVIVFTLGGSGGARHAAELQWIREVVTLGFVTVIPGAPPGLVGAVNLRGNLVPVLEPTALLASAPGASAGSGAATGSAQSSGSGSGSIKVPVAAPRQGDPALVVEDRGVVAALHVETVHEVATCHAEGDGVVDGRGRTLPLLDPREVVRRALAAVQATRGDGGPAVG
jgi:chemotaxis signal transduction protein